MLQEMILVHTADAPALVGTAAMVRAFDAAGHPCAYLVSANPFDPGLPAVIEQARRNADGALPPCRIHFLGWETGATDEARRAFIGAFTGVDKIATIIASEEEQHRWRQALGEQLIADSGVTLCHSVSDSFRELAAIHEAISALLVVADEVRAGHFPGAITIRAYRAAQRNSHDAAIRFIQSALASDLSMATATEHDRRDD